VHEPLTSPACLAGVGLKAAHLPTLLDRGPEGFLGGAGFLEVHAQNYMVAGGPMLRHLERVCERWPLSIHGVGLSIGGDGPLDADHLDRRDRLLRRFEPRWFSEHLAWSSHGGRWFNDLLPLPYDPATLNRACDHIDQVQQHLRRTLLLEAPSTYLGYAGSTMDEASFMAEAVAQIHLAGFAEDRDAAGDRLLIDHPGAAVDDAVWSLYERSIVRLGPVPTLIERDNHLPPLTELEQEAQRALDLQRALSATWGGGRIEPRAEGRVECHVDGRVAA
jgi:uncharacterized protein (UPF0276 family)